MTELPDLFGTVPAPAPPERKVRRGPIRDRVEQHFRDNRYANFTTVELHQEFPDVKLDSLRNAIRKLQHERLVKSTGGIREGSMLPHNVYEYRDFVCLTLTIGK